MHERSRTTRPSSAAKLRRARRHGHADEAAGEEAGNVRVLSEEKRLLTERADTSDKRIVGLEAEVAHARERI